MKITYLDLFLLADEYWDMKEIKFPSVEGYALQITDFGYRVKLMKNTSSGYKGIARFDFYRTLDREKLHTTRERVYNYHVTIYPYSRPGVMDKKLHQTLPAQFEIIKPNEVKKNERLVACSQRAAFGSNAEECTTVLRKILSLNELPISLV